MRAYWLSRQDGTTEYQLIPAEIGRTDSVEGKIIPCDNGLHGSRDPFDTLFYGGGGLLLWEVELPDDAKPHGKPIDKYAGSQRSYVACVDLTDRLTSFPKIREFIEAEKTLDEAKKAYNEEYKAYEKMAWTARDEAQKTLSAVWKALIVAWKARDASRAACECEREAFNEMCYHRIA